MKYRIGNTEFEAQSSALTLELCDSTDLMADPEALHARLERDGYLYLRNFHDRDMVLNARREILERLDEQGQLDASAPLMEGVASPHASEKATASVRGNEALKTRGLYDLLHSERAYSFFERFLGAPALTYEFQWLRAAAPGAGSPIHADLPYMGRGTKNLFTLWTPLGDMTPAMGPLALCLGSHNWPGIRETYAASDVDRDSIPGIFTHDSGELVEKFGGQWATAPYQAGDAVILGMYLLHGSLTNQSRQFRISCDTRWQRADEAIDDRWAGEKPNGHEVLWSANPQLEPVEVSRQRWGL